MAKISIVYGTRAGQTEKVAETLADEIRRRGYDVSVYNARKLPSDFSLENSKAVMIGASLHLNKYEKEVTQFLHNYNTDLKRLPSAFFSVTGTDSDPVEEHRKWLGPRIQQYLTANEWQPKMIGRFGGAISYTKYGFFTKIMMCCISRVGGMPTDTSRDHEFTNWDQVKAFANDFVNSIENI